MHKNLGKNKQTKSKNYRIFPDDLKYLIWHEGRFYSTCKRKNFENYKFIILC